MEMTERSEEDACLALYECDNDVEQAVIYLLENLEVGALVTNTKKKKNKSAQDGTGDGDEFESSNSNNNHSHRDNAREDGVGKRQRGSSSNRGGNAPNRGRSRGTGREPGAGVGDKEDGRIRNAGGRGRGGFAGRGRGRGIGGGRGRENNRPSYRQQQEPQQEIDNWDPATSAQLDNNKPEETWGDCGDWDNEEYTGSLSDTKVFTPSTQQDLSAPPGLEQQILNPPQNDYNSSGNVAGTGSVQYSTTTAAQQLRQALDMPPSVPLSAEQSQYFNTLGSGQGVVSGNAAAYQSSVQYQYSEQQQAPRSQQQQQQQQRSRARVPPPSKIPSSAVEMPDVDLPPYLDVQFGGLDFGTGSEEASYETEKYTQGIDQSGDDYAKTAGANKNANAGLGVGLQPSQLIQNSDSITSSTQADLSGGYAGRNATAGSTGQSALDQLTKPGADIYASAGATTGNAYQNLSYQTTQKGYQTGYGSNAYNATQTSNNYPASSNAYGYNQNSYQQQSQGTQSTTGQQTQTSTSAGSNQNSSG